MSTLFTAVFESVWKRKETKIFIGLAVLPVLLYALGSFFSGSNFNQISGEAGTMALADFLTLTFGMIDTMILPMIALVYLTVTVFTRERDDHTLFLYKDLNRNKIFWAKVGSLVLLIILFFAVFLLAGTLVYYTRVTSFPYASGKIFSDTSADNWSNFASFMSGFANFLFFLMITVFLSLRVKMGVTLLVTIVLDLLVLFTGSSDSVFLFLFPKSYGVNWWELENPNISLLFGGMVLTTLVYALIFGRLGRKSYQKMEF